MRRPFLFHEAQVISGFGVSLRRPGSYQVLLTQNGTVPGLKARIYDRPNALTANIPWSPMPHMSRYANPLGKRSTEIKGEQENASFPSAKLM